MAGMIIQHNLNAINANNKLLTNILGTKKATEKLSSGYRINRAADDAAGLAISEKMRAQIKGLNQAIRNANDGISLIQTAEGALDETHAMLKRLKELSVQMANGTYSDEERKYAQEEINNLKTEIDRIAEATDFNGIKLLNGNLDGGGYPKNIFGPRYATYLTNAPLTGQSDLSDSNLTLEGAVITSNVGAVTLSFADGASGVGAENSFWSDDGMTLTLNLVAGQSYTQSQINELIKNANWERNDDQTNAPATVTLSLKYGVFMFDADADFTTAAGGLAETAYAADNLAEFLVAATSTDAYANTIQLTANNYGVDERQITISTVDVARGEERVVRDTANHENNGIKDGEFTLFLATGIDYTAADIEKLLAKGGLDYKVTLSASANPNSDVVFRANTAGAELVLTLAGGAGVGADKTAGKGEGIVFQIGANSALEQRVNLNIKDMGSTSIGIATFDVSTVETSRNAMDAVEKAIVAVSGQRASLGAMQNRLEHTVNSLTVTSENLTAAESQIRDTDMAMEMVEYTKFNILQQAAQAMLAQANQAPQAILQLLR